MTSQGSIRSLNIEPSALQSRIVPHHDSEEAVQHERQRVSRELDTLTHASTNPSSTRCLAQPIASSASLRSRYTSPESSTEARQHADAASQASTEPDVPDGSEILEIRHVSANQKFWYSPVINFWTTHISPSIETGAFRDHLALERTFLGYLRTSLTLSMMGVLIAQLFRLQHSPSPNPTFGFYVLGRPLSALFISSAIVTLAVGVYRVWTLQRALIAGKALAGGWEVLFIMGLSALLLIAVFGLTLGVDIQHTYGDD